MTNRPGVNVTTSGRPVATPAESIEGSERVTYLPRLDLPAPDAAACLGVGLGQAAATIRTDERSHR